MGTGIIIDPRGYIVTNQHVVEDVNLLRVRLADGTEASARVVARDNENDLALLKIDVGRAAAHHAAGHRHRPAWSAKPSSPSATPTATSTP